MNIMAISSSICSLEVNCAATLRRFKQDGHNVHIIVVVDEGSAAIKSARSGIGGEQGVLEHQETIVAADLNTTTFVRKPLSEPTEARSIMSDLPEPQFVTQFDYSAVTQKNADILAEYRSEIRPALVIMPFWKSEDEKERVLARSTLIACRGIGSIIMYGTKRDGTRDNKFSANMLILGSRVTQDDIAPNKGSLEQYRYPSRNQNKDKEDEDESEDARGGGGTLDVFEAHRLLLLEDPENDWL